MPKSYAEVEDWIQEALGSILPDTEFSIPELAARFDIPVRHLKNRLKGTPSRNAQVPASRKLSPAEEVAVCRYIDRLDQLGLCVRPPMLRNCANVILARNHNGNSPPPTVSSRWSQRFLDHHPEYSVRKQKAMDPRRKVANNAKSIEAWFKDFCATYLEKGIQSGDCWNMDKSGFQIGLGRNQKIITKDIRHQSYIGSASNRELVTVVEAISGGGKAIPPQVILLGKIHQEWWYTHTSLEDDALISVLESGFSNDQLNYEWIKHFEEHSAKSQTGANQLLLLDGYGSHCTYEFLDHCERNKIVLFCLPPHTTHLLQSLDVVVFQPYKYWHAEAVDAAARTGCVNFNKLEFLKALGSIHQKALKLLTILSVFRETGLIPYRPKKVVDRLREKEKERQKDTEL